MPSAFQATGFGFTFDDASGFTSITTGTNLVLSYSANNPVLSYSPISVDDDPIIPDVDLNGSDIRLASVNGIVLGDNVDAAFGRVTWSGQQTDVLVLNTSETAGYFFRLGGAALPNITSVAEANAFLTSFEGNAVFPPAPFGPNTNIPLSSFDGFQPLDLSETTTYATQGFSFLDVSESGVVGLQAAEVAMTFAAPGAALFYSVYDVDTDTDLPGAGVAKVEVGFTEAPLSFTVNGRDIEVIEGELEVLIARFTTSAGVHDVLVVDDLANDRLYMTQLAGAPLPSATDAAAVAAFFQSIQSLDPIPAGQATSAGAQIPLATIPGVQVTTTDNPPPSSGEPTGDPGVIFLNGYIFQDDGDTVTAFQTAELALPVPVDNGQFTYSIIGYDDQLPLIELAGMQPYEALINGNVLGNVEISIARLVVDASTYYDVLIFFVPDTDVYSLFQIGGSGATINLTTLAEANLFADSFEGPGQQGPVPAGEPLAPGESFSLLDSDFARLDSDPLIIEGGTFFRGAGSAQYGRGAGTNGSVTVVNGAELQIGPDGTNGPFLSVGRDGGRGAMTAAGPDSAITITAGGGNSAEGSEGIVMSIGRDGGSGFLRIIDQASFQLVDNIGTSAGPGPDLWGQELLFVGRGTNGVGDLIVEDASFTMRGTGVFMGVGIQNGSGGAFLRDGATFRLESSSSGDDAELAIGRDNGLGQFVIEDSFAIVQGAAYAEARVNIGRNSGGAENVRGRLTIDGSGPNSEGDLTHGFVVAGGSNSPFVGIDVGRQGGGGLVTVTGGFLVAQNTGVTYDDALNEIVLAGSGGDAQIRIGREGSGTVTVTAESELVVDATGRAQLIVGIDAGGSGTLTLDNSSGVVTSEDGFASVLIGAAGATGLATLRNGATLTVTGGDNALVEIGAESGRGTMVLTGAGTSLTVAEDRDIEIATFGDDSEGVLWVGTGAQVTAGHIQIGSATAELGALVLAGGSVTATNGVQVNANAGVGGAGTLTGALTLTNGTISVGDTYDVASGEFGSAIGQMNVTGNVTATNGTAQFDFGTGGADFLNITGNLGLTTSTIEVTYLGTYTPESGPLEQMLARATGGITMDGVTLEHNLSTDPTMMTNLELRAGGTELWVYHGPATVTLSGTVSIREVLPGSISAAGTGVTFTASDGAVFNATTDATGAFSFDVPIGSSGTLELVRDYSTAQDKSLIMADVIRMFQMINGRIAAEDFGAQDIIAADFDGDGAANMADVIDLFRFVSGRDTDPSPRYVFVDDADDLSGVTFNQVPLNAPFAIGAMNADLSLSMTAILTGDFNGHV